ncbi:MAG TPA: hypothetical protein PLI82_08565 [Candidatus Sumerlaeota bacterium]|nr:MAG: hypothetical protein BWY12_00709 [candidate division BRC1 bacterium ADurb.Bin183]HOE63272.1 hypothetical protein [Candidatus Sumerlaeota bacterium]HRR29860.1 hypothetical protein [Candidatus Sumerlaeia bacterium]HON50630.1 hypothetical protein [Candidatus Sumerlaeota bacterium]HOR65452.1 hypothetical protein [Candidatus Sumerlaeota bacterium]
MICKLKNSDYKLKELSNRGWLIFIIYSSFMICNLCFGEAAPWISGHAITPSISYQYRIEQRPGMHQQIHRVIADLRGENVSVGLIPSGDFPKGLEYASSVRTRTNAQVVVPAPLFIKSGVERFLPLGSLLIGENPAVQKFGYPLICARPLNRIFLLPNGGGIGAPNRMDAETSGSIAIEGYNIEPERRGFYLFTKIFSPITGRQFALWGAEECLWLERVSSGDASLYTIRRITQTEQTAHIPDKSLLLVSVNQKRRAEASGFAVRSRVRLVSENPALLQFAFCGGPQFLKDGEYDEEAVKAFCALPGAPAFSHYTERKARLALTLDASQRYLGVYAVDQKGFMREGMSLEEFAEFLKGEGATDAAALPDGDMASLILPDGLMNATPSGLESPSLAFLTISERATEKGRAVNLLRSVPNSITACGAEPRNPPDALKDGSYSLADSLDNYWEHASLDPSHQHGILIDLLKPYSLDAIEVYHAEEAGFSPHYNARLLSIYGGERDKNSMEKIMDIVNRDGRSCQRAAFPANCRLRYIRIEFAQPSAFSNISCVRLAEVVLLGRLE